MFHEISCQQRLFSSISDTIAFQKYLNLNSESLLTYNFSFIINNLISLPKK